MAPRTERPGPRRRLSPDDRKAELLDAALAIARETGDLEAASLERVAEVAGCSRNLAYRYFAHHDGLIDALSARMRDELLAGVAGLPRDLPTRVWLAGVTDALLDQARRHGPLLLLLFERPGGQLDRSQRQLLVGALADRLRRDGMTAARARVVAPILGAALVGAVGAAVNGAGRRAVLAEVETLLDAFLG